MSVTELFANVRKVVQTGLVIDIPWLPDFQMFKEEVYVKPKDYEDKHLAMRLGNAKYTLNVINEGAEKLPGEGSLLEKTVRTMKGLESCKHLTIVENWLEGLNLTEQKIPETYHTSTGTTENTRFVFIDPRIIAHYANDYVDAISAEQAFVQELAQKVLVKAPTTYQRTYSRWSGHRYDVVVRDESKKLLERIVNEPKNLLVSEKALQKMNEIADGTYGLPLSEIKDFR